VALQAGGEGGGGSDVGTLPEELGSEQEVPLDEVRMPSRLVVHTRFVHGAPSMPSARISRAS
jgi:hypothetical protein